MNSVYRLKSSIKKDHLKDRLQYNPHTIELHLVEEDLKTPKKISTVIRELRDMGVFVTVHHPMKMNDEFVDINNENYKRDAYFFQLGLMSQLADELDVFVIFHGNYKCKHDSIDKELSDETLLRLKNVLPYVSKNILWENSFWSSISYKNPYVIDDIIKPLELPLCFDVSHAFIDFKGDNVKLLNTLKEVEPFVKHYHVVDSFGLEHDSLTLGDGLIDFSALKPYIEKKSYIFEVGLKDVAKCDEMIQSANYFKSL